jgi:NCS1 family nucleobase:cation symporter-1
MEETNLLTNERTTGSWDSFAMWFNANANNSTWFTGGVLAAAGVWTASLTLNFFG